MRALALVFGLLMAMAAVAQARPNPPSEKWVHPFYANLPECSDQAVLGIISTAFASREASYWNSALTIGGYDRIRQSAFRPWGRDFIPRRFCEARARTNDGRLRHVRYFVRETTGLFGNTWEVIWCVVGLDRGRTYAPGCEQATPW
jgi:hypothetical protein